MPNTPTTDPIYGYNKPPDPTPNQPPIIDPLSQSGGWLNNGITQRDLLSQRTAWTSTGFVRPLWVSLLRDGLAPLNTEIKPHPYISRVGSRPRPYRLLSGREIQLSEDDIRISGVSKRYPLDMIWQWGALYFIDPVFTSGVLDRDKSTACELIYINDANPLYWELNVRRRDDSRGSAIEYDIP